MAQFAGCKRITVPLPGASNSSTNIAFFMFASHQCSFLIFHRDLSYRMKPMHEGRSSFLEADETDGKLSLSPPLGTPEQLSGSAPVRTRLDRALSTLNTIYRCLLPSCNLLSRRVDTGSSDFPVITVQRTKGRPGDVCAIGDAAGLSLNLSKLSSLKTISRPLPSGLLHGLVRLVIIHKLEYSVIHVFLGTLAGWSVC